MPVLHESHSFGSSQPEFCRVKRESQQSRWTASRGRPTSPISGVPQRGVTSAAGGRRPTTSAADSYKSAPETIRRNTVHTVDQSAKENILIQRVGGDHEVAKALAHRRAALEARRGATTVTEHAVSESGAPHDQEVADALAHRRAALEARKGAMTAREHVPLEGRAPHDQDTPDLLAHQRAQLEIHRGAKTYREHIPENLAPRDQEVTDSFTHRKVRVEARRGATGVREHTLSESQTPREQDMADAFAHRQARVEVRRGAMTAREHIVSEDGVSREQELADALAHRQAGLGARLSFRKFQSTGDTAEHGQGTSLDESREISSASDLDSKLAHRRRERATIQAHRREELVETLKRRICAIDVKDGGSIDLMEKLWQEWRQDSEVKALREGAKSLTSAHNDVITYAPTGSTSGSNASNTDVTENCTSANPCSHHCGLLPPPVMTLHIEHTTLNEHLGQIQEVHPEQGDAEAMSTCWKQAMELQNGQMHNTGAAMMDNQQSAHPPATALHLEQRMRNESPRRAQDARLECGVPQTMSNACQVRAMETSTNHSHDTEAVLLNDQQQPAHPPATTLQIDHAMPHDTLRQVQDACPERVSPQTMVTACQVRAMESQNDQMHEQEVVVLDSQQSVHPAVTTLHLEHTTLNEGLCHAQDASPECRNLETFSNARQTSTIESQSTHMRNADVGILDNRVLREESNEAQAVELAQLKQERADLKVQLDEWEIRARQAEDALARLGAQAPVQSSDGEWNVHEETDGGSMSQCDLLASVQNKLLDAESTNLELLERETCCVCQDNRRNVVLQPCLHFALCNMCALGLSNCPICRTSIERRDCVIMS